MDCIPHQEHVVLGPEKKDLLRRRLLRLSGKTKFGLSFSQALDAAEDLLGAHHSRWRNHVRAALRQLVAEGAITAEGPNKIRRYKAKPA